MFATDFNPGADTFPLTSPACARLATQSAPKKIAAGAVRLIAFIRVSPIAEIPPTVPPKCLLPGTCAYARAKLWPGLWSPRNGRFHAEQRLPRSDWSSVSALIKKLQL